MCAASGWRKKKIRHRSPVADLLYFWKNGKTTQKRTGESGTGSTGDARRPADDEKRTPQNVERAQKSADHTPRLFSPSKVQTPGMKQSWKEWVQARVGTGGVSLTKHQMCPVFVCPRVCVDGHGLECRMDERRSVQSSLRVFKRKSKFCQMELFRCLP